MSKRRELISPLAIGCYTYSVFESAEPFKAGRQHATSNGYVNHEEMEMVIKPLAACSQRETLLHEVLHGVRRLADLPSDKREEAFITRIAPLLLDTLRRNRHLCEFLLAKEDEVMLDSVEAFCKRYQSIP